MKRALLLIVLTTACQLGGSTATAPPLEPSGSHYRPVPGGEGGRLVVGDWEYPASLDPIHAATESELRLTALLFSPLWGTDPDLVAYPDLVREVPSLANGDIRIGRDGSSMSVDLKLVPGLRWSDGEPITADDVIFTVDAICSATLPGRDRTGFDHIASQERRSVTEVIWHFGPRPRGSCGLAGDLSSGLYPAVEVLGPRAQLLPSHLLAKVPDTVWATLPFFKHPEASSGPFAFRGAVGSQLIDLAANPHYRDGRAAPGVYHQARPRFDPSPRLDRLTYRFFNGRAAEVAALGNGEAEIGFHLLPSDLTELGSAPAIRTVVTPTLRVESIHPNHGANTGSGRLPPWVGDQAVLAALDLAVDRQALDDAAFAGAATVSTGLFPSLLRAKGLAPLRPLRRSIGTARQTLDEDGWRLAADGIRAKGGQRLEFSLVAPCESAPGAAEEAELVREWAELGAAVRAACSPGGQLLGGYSAGGILSRGAFDMSLYSNALAPDGSAWSPYGESSGIPSATNPAGLNWDRCSDPVIDQELARGGSRLDALSRRAAYGALSTEWLAYRCSIPLLEWPSVVERSTRVRNFLPNPAWVDTWNAADWSLG